MLTGHAKRYLAQRTLAKERPKRITTRLGTQISGRPIGRAADGERLHAAVAPLGDAILYIATFSGARLNFGIGSVAGVVAGSLGAALLSRGFRWEACDDARELKRHLAGALLMGIGGIMSMGCTIGQGLTAFSSLALSAPITMLAIAAGARLGLEFTMTGEWLPAVRRLFGT